MKSNRERYRQWLRSRPASVRVLATKVKPWHRYVITATGQECTLYSLSENGTLTVTTAGPFGLFQYNVFGLTLSDLKRAPSQQSPARQRFRELGKRAKPPQNGRL